MCGFSSIDGTGYPTLIKKYLQMKTNNINFDEVLKIGHSSIASIEIVKKVVHFIWECDKTVVQDFYIGVTNYPEKRIFEGHRVRPDSSRFLIVEAPNEDIALEAEEVLLSLDVTGGIEKNKGRFIYCYYIDGMTRETNYENTTYN
jgi:hypothetical protein